jgi:ribosome-associated protein
MQKIDFEIRGEFITLDRLLKATGLAGSGGGAKTMVAEGKVQVDGQDELRKTAKLRAGQVVSLTGARIRLLAAGAAATAEDQEPAE